MFTPKSGGSQGNIWNKISILKGNTGGESEAETWIEIVKSYGF